MSAEDWTNLAIFVVCAACYCVPIAVAWWLTPYDDEQEDEPRELTFDEMLAGHPELDELTCLTTEERDGLD